MKLKIELIKIKNVQDLIWKLIKRIFLFLVLHLKHLHTDSFFGKKYRFPTRLSSFLLAERSSVIAEE
jgi:hypothetical protein